MYATRATAGSAGAAGISGATSMPLTTPPMPVPVMPMVSCPSSTTVGNDWVVTARQAVTRPASTPSSDTVVAVVEVPAS